MIEDIIDRKKAELALYEKERYFNLLIENANDIFVIVKENGAIKYESPSFERILGYKSEEFVGKDAFSFIHNDDISKAMNVFVQTIRDPGMIGRTELRLMNKLGSWRFFEVVAKNLLHDRSVQGIVFIFHDITEQKNAVDALKHSAEYYRALIENVHDAIVVINADGSFRYLNPSVINSLKNYPKVKVGDDAIRFIHSDDLSISLELLSRLRNNPGSTIDTEVRVIQNDGSFCTFEVTGTNLLMDPSVEGIVVTFRDISRRRLAEENLLRSQADLKLAQEIVHLGFWEWSLNTNRVHLSEELCHICGVSADEFFSVDFSVLNKIIHPSDIDIVGNAIRDVLRDKKSGPVEFRIVRPNGIQRWVLVSQVLSDAGDSQMIRIFGSVLDISDRKQMEEILKRSEAHFRSLVENLHEVIVIVNYKDRTIRYASPSIVNLLGYKPEDIIGKTGLEFVHPDDTFETVNIFSHIGENPKGVSNLTLRVKHKEGSWRVIEVVAQNLLDDKTVNSIVIHFSDITDRRKAEEELIEYRQHLEDLIEEQTIDLERANLQLHNEILERQQLEEDLKIKNNAIMASIDAICIAEIKGGIKYINPSFLTLWGYTSGDEIIGRSAMEFWKSQESIMLVVKAIEETGSWQGELVAVKKDGSTFDAHVSASVFKDETGRISYFMSSIIDITDRKKTQQEMGRLYESEKQIRKRLEAEIDRRIEFNRALVHELKTPLTPIVISSQVLTHELKDGNLLSLAKNISRGAVDLNNRIDELVDLVKGEMGILKLKIEYLDLFELLNEIVSYISPITSAKGQKLVLDVPVSIPDVYADRVRLRQTVLNLLNNALRYTHKGDTVTLRARSENSNIIVEVIDTGVGIEEEKLHRLFKPYYRVESDIESLGGLGLGLVLCKTLVELHDGKIWARSQKGMGSTFGFSIPLAVPNSIMGSR